MMKWTNSFCIKLITCIIISMNYASMAIVFTDIFSYYSYLFFINSFVWLVNASLLYFEYRRKLPQSWCGLRSFWFLNGVLYIFKYIFLLTYLDPNNQGVIRGLLLLYIIQGLFSMNLLYYSIFKPKDYETLNSNLNEFFSLSESSLNNNRNSFSDLEEKIETNGNKKGLVSIAEIDNYGNVHALTGNDRVDIGINKQGNKMISCKKDIQPLIRVTICEIKSRKFSCNQEKIQNVNKLKIRFIIKINLPLEKEKANNKRIKNKTTEKEFSVKKCLNDVVSFNNQILEKFERKINYVSPLKIQLKNITDIIIKFSSSCCNNIYTGNNNTVSSELDIDTISMNNSFAFNNRLPDNLGKVTGTNNYPGTNNKTNNNNSHLLNKIKTLEAVYVNLCRNFVFFLPEFLKFLDVKDTELIESLTRHLENINTNFNFQNLQSKNLAIADGSLETYQIQNQLSNNNSNSNSNEKIVSYNNFYYNNLNNANDNDKAYKETNLNQDLKKEDFYSEVDIQSNNNNDLIKTMTFINNVITNDKYLRINITGLKEKKNLLDSEFICEMIVCDNKTNIIVVNVSYKSLLDYCENYKIRKTGKIQELKSLIIDTKNILQLKKDKSWIRKKLSENFTRLINDLFYFDSDLFSIFEINKLLNLEINEIEDMILNSFFELERKSSLNVHLIYDNHILKEKNILNYRILCEFDRVEKLETHNNSHYFIIFFRLFAINLSKKTSQISQNLDDVDLSTIPDDGVSWDVEINLNDLNSLFSDLVQLNSNNMRFCDLQTSLNTTIQLLENIMRILNTDNNNNNISLNMSSKSLKGNSERISMNSIKSRMESNLSNLIDEFIEKLNNLFVAPNIYILYSEQFRHFFSIDLLFEKKKSVTGSSNRDLDEQSDKIFSSSNKSILENLLN